MNQKVKFIAVLKSETKGKAFYEYGGDFDDLPKSEAECKADMDRGVYLPGEYTIMTISKDEAEEFVTVYHPLV